MTREQRQFRKDMLVIKGEAQRLRLSLEVERFRQPGALLRHGLDAWQDQRATGRILGLLHAWLPSARLRGWARQALRGYVLWRLVQRLLQR